MFLQEQLALRAAPLLCTAVEGNFGECPRAIFRQAFVSQRANRLLIGVDAVLFFQIHSGVCSADQFVRSCTVLRIGRRADRRSDNKLMALKFRGIADCLVQPLL
jgi:hypothetical protein